MMKRRSWRRFGLVLASLVLSLSLAEAAVGHLFPYFRPWTVRPDLVDRSTCEALDDFDEHTGWWGKPNLNCVAPHEGGGTVVRTNSAGLRADRDYQDKTPGVMRVGVFGDSFTVANQVNAEETYAAIIGRRVPNVEVLNFGLGSGGPDQSLLVLRHKAAGFDLDALIIAPLVENIVRTQMAERDGY
jgi:hypothetical protein